MKGTSVASTPHCLVIVFKFEIRNVLVSFNAAVLGSLKPWVACIAKELLIDLTFYWITGCQ